MKFEVKRIANPNLPQYKKHDIDIAYDFSKKVYHEFGNFIKAIVLFGSVTKPRKKEGDIDVLIIIDDVTVKLTPEFVESYRVIVQRIVLHTSPMIHVTTMKLTNFFEYAKVGDPIGINMLRDGVPLVDTGFFEPMQMLLKQGRIRPTKESIWTYYAMGPMTVQNSRWHIMQGCLDLYWAVIDVSHAALMKIGEIPPSPDHVSDMVVEKLIKKGYIPKKYTHTVSAFYELSRKILHREIPAIRGIEYDHYYALANEYIRVMRQFIEKGE